jgi:hypothetical protein
MLMFTLVKVAATPVFTKVKLAVLSIAQQEGGTLMMIAKAKFITSLATAGVIVAVAPGTTIPLFCNSTVIASTVAEDASALKVT